ncbi:T9SS type A sorting domain-containing protein [Mangrovimonas sp. YM274]|uniref:T9SS type A sorting domain-containing protein n=1 Tax=Mangrovimonas sp. YM274 TaxID=3070660 RepID=UPI0027DB0205|nr:T9SS type A sorting domain-containing protein [Mangrovimonas sp. YM274]WMI67812.1 T9SS type A sorting domain-containing protein [Mangrovimonas sp. YM274]
MKQKLLFLGLSLFFFSFQAQVIVDCDEGPLFVTACYENNSYNEVTYTSSNGNPLMLMLIGGAIENGNDTLKILDSDGSTNLYWPTGQVVPGTFIMSIGDSITFSVVANETVSCASGELEFSEGISYMVYCVDFQEAVDVELGADQNICEETPAVLLQAEISSTSTYNYEWYQDGILISGATTDELVVTESAYYSVIIYDPIQEVPVGADATLVNFIDCENSGLIHVNIFLDANSNSVFDTGEAYFDQAQITYELNDSGYFSGVMSNTGSFTLYTSQESDSYDFNLSLQQNCYYSNTTTLSDITVSNGAEITLDFPIMEIEDCEDMYVHLYTYSPPVPGFPYNIQIQLENYGTQPNSGELEFVLDESLPLSELVVNDSPNYTIINTSTGFILEFMDIEGGSEIYIPVTVECPTTLALGETVTNSVTYTSNTDEINTNNNTASLTETVVGSYDPNDIMESHGPQILYDEFITSDEYLYYTIRFQNVGTAEAFEVRIEDVLDVQLDETTFEMLHSSHDYVVTRTGNLLVWQFDDINLPSESMDEPESHGYVHFKIKPVSGYGVGDVIPNSAAIFFDFNEPVITNTFSTEFVEILSVEDQETAEFSIHPNPANDMVYIQIEEASSELRVNVFDVLGKRVLETSYAQEQEMALDVSSLESGIYYIQLHNGARESIKKLVVK